MELGKPLGMGRVNFPSFSWSPNGIASIAGIQMNGNTNLCL